MTLMTIECPDGVEPGAALVIEGPNGEDIQVVVPEGVGPGDTFEVDVGGEEGAAAAPEEGEWTPRSGMMDITVPEGVAPGQALLITTPAGQDVEVVVPDGLEPGDTFQVSIDDVATPNPAAEDGDDEDWGDGGEESASAPTDEDALKLQREEGARGQAMTVTVPDGVEPGQALLVTGPDGNDLEVVVPDGLGSGDTFQVELGQQGAAPPEEVKKEFKLIILGSAGAGKSCLVSRLLADEFNDTHTPTIGMEHEKHVLTSPSNKLLKLQVWDRAGVATYGAIEKAYWKKAAAAMLVYDAADRESFNYINTVADGSGVRCKQDNYT